MVPATTPPTPRATYLSDKETGATVLYEASLNQLFATRGLGKSIVTNALLKCLIGGKDFLRLKSAGGLNVLLVDAELPPIQLQERLKEFGDMGQLKILSPYLMPDPKAFPNLSQAEGQQRFTERIAGLDALIGGLLLIHEVDHALRRCRRRIRPEARAAPLPGEVQRGRTDGDDNLDVSIQLEKPYGWQPGDGLAFKWKYSKVRHGGHLPDFEASYEAEGGWRLVEDGRLPEVMKLHAAGKSTRAIATALDMGQSAVSRLIRKANQNGLAALNAKAGAESESVSQ